MGRDSLQAYKVLSVFLGNPKRQYYGLELAREAGVPSGSLYPILASFEQRGWVTSEWEDIDESQEKRRRRRYYVLTQLGAGAGEQAIRAELAPITERLGWFA